MVSSLLWSCGKIRVFLQGSSQILVEITVGELSSNVFCVTCHRLLDGKIANVFNGGGGRKPILVAAHHVSHLHLSPFLFHPFLTHLPLWCHVVCLSMTTHPFSLSPTPPFFSHL